jgi:hypothetical protein
MPTIRPFGPWSERDHTGTVQLNSLHAATTGALTPMPGTLDREAQCCSFWGSKQYETTLATCTCPVYTRKHIPCKHIYRLAMELGYIDAEVKTAKPAGQRRVEQLFGKDEAIAALEAMTEAAQREAMKHLRSTQSSQTSRYDPFIVEDAAIAQELRECPLFEELPLDPKADFLVYRGRAELVELVKQAQSATPYTGPVNRKAPMVDWLVENATNLPDLMPTRYKFACIHGFDIAQVAVCKYLVEKYDPDSITHRTNLSITFNAVMPPQ